MPASEGGWDPWAGSVQTTDTARDFFAPRVEREPLPPLVDRDPGDESDEA